jgi:hypothetical protein
MNETISERDLNLFIAIEKQKRFEKINKEKN